MKLKSHIKFVILTCILIFMAQPSALSASNMSSKQKFAYQLSLTAIFRDEACYLKEWIEYHKLIGVEHFYLYNNLSTDHYKEVLTPYIECGEVELIEWSTEPKNIGEWDKLQIAAYKDALSKAKGVSKWLAIIDTDEFIVPCKATSLLDVLKNQDKLGLGGVCLMWSFFGTSDVEKIPDDKLLIESLVFHSGPAAGGKVADVWNTGAYKSIVRPKYVNNITSPHYCGYKKGRKHKMLSYEQMHINHYWTRDEYFLNNYKIPRRKKWGQSSESVKSWAGGMNVTQSDNPILKFVPKLRKRMGFK